MLIRSVLNSDQCNQLRTRCDGKSPCAHCIGEKNSTGNLCILTAGEFNLACEYARERKKRGKASKKDLAQQQALAAAAGEISATSPQGSSADPSPIQGAQAQETENAIDDSKDDSSTPDQIGAPKRSKSMNQAVRPSRGLEHQENQPSRSNSFSQIPETVASGPVPRQMSRDSLPTPFAGGFSDMNINGFGSIQEDSGRNPMEEGLSSAHMIRSASHQQPAQSPMIPPHAYQTYTDSSYSMMGSQDASGNINNFRFGNASEGSSAAFLSMSPGAPSPGWLSLPSPSATNFPYVPRNNVSLRYPVLQPVIPYITQIIPQYLACDLLELYFTSSSAAHLRPLSPYVLGYIFRKRSILHQSTPRSCSPALLASMLWVAAQTSDAAFLTSPPSARGRICQKLLEVTISLLRPLVHGPTPGETSPNYSANAVINGVALGGFGVSVDTLGPQSGATGTIDDVATYIHLATVVSASEHKAASLRWWNAAWSLARELKLNRELPVNPTQTADQNMPEPHHEENTYSDTGALEQSNAQGSSELSGDRQGQSNSYSEEEREERRRIWWLLYTMDRHLALCYNRPLFLLDKECDGLLQPMNDTLWQAGDFSNADYAVYPVSTSTPHYRRRGPSYECTGHSIFGYFLPLMTILGEIVDLHHARNHPRFGLAFRSADEWGRHAQEISNQLNTYGQSLNNFEVHFTSTIASAIEQENGDANLMEGATPSVKSSGTSTSRLTESIIQTKIVVAYGTQIMHVLHILLTGKWDPISLLDDNDLWIASQSFLDATSHAVSAAKAVADILENDPDLTFMPFFFGMYLLQGSFLLLLIADKLQGEATSDVVQACETIVRAHEACVATLNTEYQVRPAQSGFLGLLH